MGLQNYKHISNPRNPICPSVWHRVVAPVKVGLKSPRVEFENTKHNEEILRLNLDLLEEKREQALKRADDYHKKTAKYYDRRVRLRSFRLDDLVLKKLLPARKDPTHGKLGPN